MKLKDTGLSPENFSKVEAYFKETDGQEVSLTEIRNTLEISGFDVVSALVILERSGAVTRVQLGHWKARTPDEPR